MEIRNIKSKKSFKLKFASIVCFLFLLYFFSNTLIYAQSNEKNNADYLVPLGNVIQIDAELQNLVVRNQVENSPFIVGDSLLSINNIKVNNYGEFSKILSSLNSKETITALVKRGSNEFTLNTTKDKLEEVNFNNLISGFATLTYIDPKTSEFGAVGHPISIGNHRKIEFKNGCISTTTDLNIEKSYRGNVGCINAKRKDTIGQFTINEDFGIKGKIVDYNISDLKKYKVAKLNEVKLGKAEVILQVDSNRFEKFDIQILDIENQNSAKAKTFKISITDKNLLARTGGIVQGMSGTPIVQNDKIVGAISHAVENNPTLGYGVFIQWMLNQ
ncbi:MAG: SpoIVB peptidase S55 domain-containing protein [Peptostreptococcaceae bacterium]